MTLDKSFYESLLNASLSTSNTANNSASSGVSAKSLTDQINKIHAQQQHQNSQQQYQNSLNQDINNQIGGQEYGNWQAASQIYGNPFIGADPAGQSYTGVSTISSIGAIYGTQFLAYHRSLEEPISPPVENTGLKVGEITAWRMWRETKGYLESYSAGKLWAPEEPMTGKPQQNGHEGIWAFKEKKRALAKMIETSNGVYGSVKLWGEIIEYEDGYKAQYARIASLDGINKDVNAWRRERALDNLRKTYKLNK